MITNIEQKKEIQRRIDSGDPLVGGTGGEGWYLNLETEIMGYPIEPKFVCYKNPSSARKAYIKYLIKKGYKVSEDRGWYRFTNDDGKVYRLSQCGGTSQQKLYKVL